MTVERISHCKVNLLLNILGRRADGFHELETLMHPVWVFDRITIEEAPVGIALRCSDASLPVDARNLVYRAAEAYLRVADVKTGLRLTLEKNLPVAAGLGGGSGNAASTLLGLNELFETRLTQEKLLEIASSLGSDIPFFLQDSPALAFGRGEKIEPVGSLVALKHAAFVLVHPGFGISTPWAYKELARFPEARNGRPGRAAELAGALRSGSLHEATRLFYNVLEAPALEKFPLLGLYKEFFRERGAVSLMSGSGSSVFAIFDSMEAAKAACNPFKERFGDRLWMAVCPCAKP